MNAIEHLQAAIAERRGQLASLEYALALLQAPPGAIAVPVAECRVAEPPAKKPTPPAATGPPEAGTARRSTIERRHAIARFLAESGPQSMGKIEVKIGAMPATIRTDLTLSGLFQRVDPDSRRSPWTLTESGRRLAESDVPG